MLEYYSNLRENSLIILLKLLKAFMSISAQTNK